WAPGRAGRRLAQALERRGIVFEAGEVVGRTSAACQLADGRILPCDALVLATGLEAPPLIGALGLPVGADGRLRVSPQMQSVANARVFAVGDCAVIDGAERPAAGVFGVRAAPILLANLMAVATNAPLRAYHPQPRWLSIMDLGDGTGLALRGGLWSHGRAALWLKRRLDLGFVARVGRLRPGA
ncbi:MAG: FAD-dependent oxidoreductase, partial [Phenylobacterium sp.]|uniref:FAD-dependent oxidoreductase n=1 Tax=Phenylobacterium sp. TaxID=1871053 RepID=UPI002717AC20